MRFATLGMVVLDEIYFPLQAPMKDVVGGSGAYSTLGARLFSPKADAQSIGWTIRAGSDLPSAIRTTLESWNTSLVLMEDADGRSTRGRLEYQDAAHNRKTFQYLTPILSILPEHLKTTGMLDSESFHFLADPEEIINQVQQLLTLRNAANINSKPLLIWEPRPSSCVPANLNAFVEAVRMADVFSPNHVELGAIFGHSHSSHFNASTLEQQALTFTTSGIGVSGKGSVVIRAGEHGCFIASSAQSPKWFPPFYEQMDSGNTDDWTISTKVIDPTGAGNAFLGAFAIGFLDTGSIFEAACYGIVGSSFALEQIGLPTLDANDHEEFWNGESVFSRLTAYKRRLDQCVE